MDAIEAKSSARATRAKNLRHKGHGRGGRGHNQGGGERNKLGGQFHADSPPSASEAQRTEREPLAGNKFDDDSTHANIAKASVAKHGVTKGRGGEWSVEPLIDDRYSSNNDAVWRTGGAAVGATASSGSGIGRNIWQTDDRNLAEASRTKEVKADEEGHNGYCRRDDHSQYDADERLSSPEAAEVGSKAALPAGKEHGGQVFTAVSVSSQGEDYAALLEHQFGDFSFPATARLKSSWNFPCRWEVGDFDDPLGRNAFLPCQEGLSKSAGASEKEAKEDLLSVDVDHLADALATMPWSFCLSVEEEILPQEMRWKPAEPSPGLEACASSDFIEHIEHAKKADMTTISGRVEASTRSKVEALSAEGIEGRAWMSNNSRNTVEDVNVMTNSCKVEMASSSSKGRTLSSKHSDAMATSTSVEKHSVAAPIPEAIDDERLVKACGKSDEVWRKQKPSSYTPAAAGPRAALWANRHQESGRPTSLREEESKAAPATTTTRVSPSDDGSGFPPPSTDFSMGVLPVPRTSRNHPEFKKVHPIEGEMWGKDKEGGLWRGEVLSGDSKLEANNQRITSSQVTGNYSDVGRQKQHGAAILRNRVGTESRMTSSRSTVDVGSTPGHLTPEDELDDLLDVLDGTSAPSPVLLRKEILSTAARSDPSSAVVGASRLAGRPRVIGPLSGPRQESSWSVSANATKQLGAFPEPGAVVNKKYNEVRQMGTRGQRETTAQVCPLPTGWPQKQGPNKQQQANGLGFMTTLPNTLAVPRNAVGVKGSPLGVSTGANEGPKGKMKANLRPISQMNIPTTATPTAIEDDEFDAWFDSIR